MRTKRHLTATAGGTKFDSSPYPGATRTEVRVMTSIRCRLKYYNALQNRELLFQRSNHCFDIFFTIGSSFNFFHPLVNGNISSISRALLTYSLQANPLSTTITSLAKHQCYKQAVLTQKYMDSYQEEGSRSTWFILLI